MNKHAANLTLAILIIIIPLLGFPGTWKSFFVIILALASGIISFRLYRQDLTKNLKLKNESKSTTYVDNLNEKDFINH